MMNKLRKLDAHPKINEDFFNRTISGGLITLFSSILMFLLFFSELRVYTNHVTETKLVVDTSRGETLSIYFDVTFPAIACSFLSVDSIDISGEGHLDIQQDISKKRLDKHGNSIEVKPDGIRAVKEKPLQKHIRRLGNNETYCGSCYGAEAADHECCNSCEDVREAYRKKGWVLSNLDLFDQCSREGFLEKIKEQKGEGCNIYGFLQVYKVAGNFHFAPGKSFGNTHVHVHDLQPFQKDTTFNLTHKINRLAFGKYFPGVVNPLDGVSWTQNKEIGLYQYFIKVVPTVYTDVSGKTIKTNQFSVTEHCHSKDGETGSLEPHMGVFFMYDLSPIKVTFTEQHVSFFHFLTNVCAIIGGIFTVSGIIDSCIYHGQNAMKKKMEIGKII